MATIDWRLLRRCSLFQRSHSSSLHLPGRRCPQRTANSPAMTPSGAGARQTARHRIVRSTCSRQRLSAWLSTNTSSGLALAGGAFHEHRFAVRLRDVCSPRPPPAQVPGAGSFRAFGLKPFQQLSALVVLQSPTGPFPLQQLTDRTRDFSNSESGKLTRSLAHQLQFARAERASAEGQRFGHAI
jgi:hypothetical protein